MNEPIVPQQPPPRKWRFAPLIVIAISAVMSVLGFGLCASDYNRPGGNFGAGLFFVGIGGIVLGLIWGFVQLMMGWSNKRP